jgi:hypothetical protein
MPWDYVSGEWYDDSDVVPPQANDWYDEFLRSLGIDPKTATGTGSDSPSNQEILNMIGASSGFGGLLKSIFGNDFGKIIGGLGLSKLLQSTGVYGGPNVYKGYTGGIPRLTAKQEMLPIPTTTQEMVTPPGGGAPVATTVPRRPGSGGITYAIWCDRSYTENGRRVYCPAANTVGYPNPYSDGYPCSNANANTGKGGGYSVS